MGLTINEKFALIRDEIDIRMNELVRSTWPRTTIELTQITPQIGTNYHQALFSVSDTDNPQFRTSMDGSFISAVKYVVDQIKCARKCLVVAIKNNQLILEVYIWIK